MSRVSTPIVVGGLLFCSHFANTLKLGMLEAYAKSAGLKVVAVSVGIASNIGSPIEMQLRKKIWKRVRHLNTSCKGRAAGYRDYFRVARMGILTRDWW